MRKTSSIRSAVLVEHRLVTDGHRHRRTQAHGYYRGCIASRGKNDLTTIHRFAGYIVFPTYRRNVAKIFRCENYSVSPKTTLICCELQFLNTSTDFANLWCWYCCGNKLSNSYLLFQITYTVFLYYLGKPVRAKTAPFQILY